MDVIILAGGLGTRLRSVVSEVPKCMAPVGDKPFLWYLLQYLTRYRDDVGKVILSVGYLRNIIIDWVDEHRTDFPFTLEFAEEQTPLGTGGGIKLALSKATGFDVVVLNGDTFFDVNLKELYQQHRLYPSLVTLALKPMNEFDRYGRVVVDDIDHHIIEFMEKEYCPSGLINGGVYVINTLNLDLNGMPEKFSFEKEVLEPECRKGNLYGVVQDGYFIDIGVPEDYERAQIELPKLVTR